MLHTKSKPPNFMIIEQLFKTIQTNFFRGKFLKQEYYQRLYYSVKCEQSLFSSNESRSITHSRVDRHGQNISNNRFICIHIDNIDTLRWKMHSTIYFICNWKPNEFIEARERYRRILTIRMRFLTWFGIKILDKETQTELSLIYLMQNVIFLINRDLLKRIIPTRR